MEHPLSPPTTALPTGSHSDWDKLSGLCETLRLLSDEVGRSLREGAGAGVLVPLLKQELEAASNLKDSIARCGQQVHPRSQELSQRLASLLEAETANQQLLQRRGLRLRGPRTRLRCPFREERL